MIGDELDGTVEVTRSDLGFLWLAWGLLHYDLAFALQTLGVNDAWLVVSDFVDSHPEELN